MAGIVGTITNLSDFLSKTQVCLSVKPNDPQQQIICLEADRKYSIPAFQREVRWDDNNLKMLLYDLSRSSKFLGNIILTIKSDHTCEIIDGQQRTTVLMLIVSCIKKKFGIKISTPDLCPLRNEGFTGFQTLLEKAFDQEAITSDDWNAILKSDDYHQLPRIQKLWNTISSSELLADRHKAQGLLDNLCKSEFNIIASYSNDVNTSIQYFLDVNLKGIRLDTEDIFKGYLFSQDSRELTRSLWQKNKRDVLRLNGVTQSSEEKRYPLMKLYEHFYFEEITNRRQRLTTDLLNWVIVTFTIFICSENFTSGQCMRRNIVIKPFVYLAFPFFQSYKVVESITLFFVCENGKQDRCTKDAID